MEERGRISHVFYLHHSNLLNISFIHNFLVVLREVEAHDGGLDLCHESDLLHGQGRVEAVAGVDARHTDTRASPRGR